MIPQEPGLRAVPPPSDAAIESAVRDVFAADSKLSESLRALDRQHSQLRDLVDWIAQTWRDLVEGLDRLRLVSPVLYWLVFIGLLLVLGLLLLHIGWTVTRALGSTGEHGAAVDGERLERRRRHADWLSAAREQAAAGDVRGAVRMLVLSLLALLEERHVLHYASSWTTREILTRLGGRVGITDAVTSFRIGVERASYGAAAPLPADYERLEATMLRLARAAEQIAEPTT